MQGLLHLCLGPWRFFILDFFSRCKQVRDEAFNKGQIKCPEKKYVHNAKCSKSSRHTTFALHNGQVRYVFWRQVPKLSSTRQQKCAASLSGQPGLFSQVLSPQSPRWRIGEWPLGFCPEGYPAVLAERGP